MLNSVKHAKHIFHDMPLECMDFLCGEEQATPGRQGRGLGLGVGLGHGLGLSHGCWVVVSELLGGSLPEQVDQVVHTTVQGQSFTVRRTVRFLDRF